MSSEKVDVTDLKDTIMEYLNDYAEEIHDDVVKITEETTKKAIDELKETSPRGKGKRATPYHLGWDTKIQIKGKNKYHRVIWNKTNYQLTHLLEFGHVTRNGGRAKAIPHIAPVAEKYNQEFVDLLKEKIRRAN